MVLSAGRALDPLTDPSSIDELVAQAGVAGATVINLTVKHTSLSHYLDQLQAYAELAGLPMATASPTRLSCRVSFELARHGPWALIVGGSEGVGAALAGQVAGRGAHVVLIARKPEPLAATAAQIRNHGVQVRTVALDVREPGAVQRIDEATGDLDIGLVVLNAGANTHRGPIAGGDLVGMADVVDLNVTVPLQMAALFGRRLLARGRGGLVVMGSLAGYAGATSHGVYAAAKAFARILTESLWLELQPAGVDVLHLVLGVTATPAMARIGLDLTDAADPEEVAAECLVLLGEDPVAFASRARDIAVIRSNVNRLAVLAGPQS